jgi:hypothetical protein
LRKPLFAALFALVCLFVAMPQAQAQTCEATNNTSCQTLGATQPCWSVYGQQTLTCWCFNHNGNLIWSCPVPAGPRAEIDSCPVPAVPDAPAAVFAAGGFPAPYCGDRCEVEGEGRGCREVTASGTFRTPCTCTNGYWRCGPI